MLGELAEIVGETNVIAPPPAHALQDASAARGLRGRGAALVLPGSPAEVEAVVRTCYSRDIPIVPRGGGTGFSGGAVALDENQVVLALDRLNRIRSFEPELWRIEVEAGVHTAHIARLAREHGLCFPPDPGAAEQSQIGGNIATNAGGPHAFRDGVTGDWVTGLEAVLAPGELARIGGRTRKDVSGYDLRALLIGSEGTLGVICAAHLRLAPAPECALVVAAAYADEGAGCAALLRVLESGVRASALEFLDSGALTCAGATYPGPLPAGAGFVLIGEVDGSPAEAARLRDELREALAPDALALADHDDGRALWRWRDGVSIAVSARRGGKLSEDVCVPVDRLAEAIGRVAELGAEHDLEACSWGHAGDGNLHATFLLDPADPGQLERAEIAAEGLFALAVELGGNVSGEHGIGWVKRNQPGRGMAPAEIVAQRRIKAALDPKNLFNPGKKRVAPD